VTAQAVIEIPPTPIIREKLGQLVRESALQRKLLRLAQQRDRLLSPSTTSAHDVETAS
jgi:hypothetical protein